MTKIKRIGISFLIAGIISFLFAVYGFVSYIIWLRTHCSHDGSCTTELHGGMATGIFFSEIGAILSAIGITLLIINRIDSS